MGPNSIGDNGAVAIAEAATTIESLRILRSVQMLEVRHRLHELTLCNAAQPCRIGFNDFGDAGVAAFARALNRTSLTELSYVACRC